MEASRKQGNAHGGKSTSSRIPQNAPGSVFEPGAPELEGPSAAQELEGMIERGAAEDPLFRFLKKRWQGLAVLALAIIAVIYGRNAMISGHEADMKRAADTFYAFRQHLSSLETLSARIDELSKKEKKSEAEEKQLQNLQAEEKDIRSRMKSSLAALQTEREPYNELARVYEDNVLATGEAKKPSVQELKGRIENFVSMPESAEKAEKFFAELVALRAARLGLGSSETQSLAVESLQKLVEKAEYVRLPAAQSLARSVTMLGLSSSERDGIIQSIEEAAKVETALADQYSRILDTLR